MMTVPLGLAHLKQVTFAQRDRFSLYHIAQFALEGSLWVDENPEVEPICGDQPFMRHGHMMFTSFSQIHGSGKPYGEVDPICSACLIALLIDFPQVIQRGSR